MDEVSSHVCLVLPSTDGKAARKIVPPRLRIPYWKGLGADSEEKHEPASDIDTVVADSLKALDPRRPIREADIRSAHVRVHAESHPPLDRGGFHCQRGEHRLGRMGEDGEQRPRRAARGALALLPVADGLDGH